MSGYSAIPNFVGTNAGLKFRQAINNALGGTAGTTPNLLAGTAATGVDLSGAVAAASITNAALRTLASRATDRINFADYTGADPTGNNDNSNLIDQALADARALNKALWFPAGRWGYANPSTIEGGDRIFGDGDATVFAYIGPKTSGANQCCFTTAEITTAIAAPVSYSAPTVLANFRVIGGVDHVTATYSTGLTGSLIQIQGCNTVVCRGLRIENAAVLGLMVAFNFNVLIEDCDFYQICRGAIQADGCTYLRVVNNRIRHGDDNALSAHSNVNQSWGRAQLIVVQGNVIEDCPGMFAQGAARTVISNNLLVRCRETGIGVAYVGSTGGGGNAVEGSAAATSVLISNNLIYDVIARGNIDGLTTDGQYIQIGSFPARAGSVYGVPGTNLAALGGSAITTRLPATQTWQAATVYPQGAQIVDGEGKVQISFPLPSWAASTAYVTGAELFDGNGNVQMCTTAGTSGTIAPAWSTTQGSTTSDNAGGGTAVWALIFVMPANQPTPEASDRFTPYQPTSGATAPSWTSSFDGITYDGGAVGTPGVRWQERGANASAGVVETYPYIDNMLTSASDSTTPIGPGLYLDVAGNHCIRTISVSKPAPYSALGFGQMFTRYGYLNPVLGQDELQAGVNGIHISSDAQAAALLKQVSITGNRVVGVASAVMVDQGPQIIGGEISRNEFVDFLNYGINFSQASVHHRLHISENLFDGDPHLQGRGSGANGAWQSSIALVRGCRANGTTGVLARGNRYRNVMAVDDGSAANWQYERNWIYCNPVTIGYSASNVGVGAVPTAGAGFLHMIEDCNPANATFGNMLNGPALYASAMPNSGIYVEGLMVWNTAPAVSAGKVTLGWLRLTTGSGNVEGTDWTPIVATVS